MKMFQVLKTSAIVSMFIVSTIASAEYFFDQGLQSAVVRTDYDALNEGTSVNPITMSPGDVLYPCDKDIDPLLLFDKCIEPSPKYNYTNKFWAPTIYANAFPWSFNDGDTASEFWVLSLNNELWYTHDQVYGTPSNLGAPNLSIPRAEPGLGIMGFKPIIWTEGGENFYRFHMVLNQQSYIDPPNPQAPEGTPFMSIGAADNRGNGSVLGYMNSQYSPSMVTWTSKVWDSVESSQPNIWASAHFLVTTAEWGGKTRMIQLALFHEGDVKKNGIWKEFHWSDPANGTSGGHSHWNWQMQESFWYPGADIVFMDAEDMYTLCGFSMPRLRNKNDSANYSVVLDDLYRCASYWDLFDSSMPYTPVPITGVHWANELVGTEIALWTSVHNMKMKRLPPTCPPFCAFSQQSQSTEIDYPPVAASANEIPNEVSLVAKRLRSSCEKSAECWQENEQYLNGKLRDRPENPNKFVGTFYDIANAIKEDK